MARKTITTREMPMKQLDRELSFMSSTSHTNIIKFYAAYISPSSSEIKLLMEFGEGGSLEAVGKRIREKGWRVGEKVAGRLAEGVRYHSYLFPFGIHRVDRTHLNHPPRFPWF
jgi:mitogen-activated protein kinase kinase